jgi:hypothetical protein
MIKLCKQIDEYFFAQFDRLTDCEPGAIGQVLLGLCALGLIINFLVM